jgi:hypothetical protein
MKIALSLFLAVAMLAGGCSFIFVSRPTEEDRRGSARCTTSNAAPVVDTLLTAFQVVRTGYALSLSDADYEGRGLSRSADVGFGIGLTALAAASAIYGFTNVGECRELAEGPSYTRMPPARTPSQSRQGRQAEEAAEEQAVRARARAKAAEEAKAAGETARAAGNKSGSSDEGSRGAP